MLNRVQRLLSAVEVHSEPLVHLFDEMFQQVAAGLRQPVADVAVEFGLKLIEGGFDFRIGPALLIDGGDPLLQIHAALNGP